MKTKRILYMLLFLGLTYLAAVLGTHQMNGGARYDIEHVFHERNEWISTAYFFSYVGAMLTAIAMFLGFCYNLTRLGYGETK